MTDAELPTPAGPPSSPGAHGADAPVPGTWAGQVLIDVLALLAQNAQLRGQLACWRDLAEKWKEVAEARGAKIDQDRRAAGKFTGGGEG